MKRWGIHFADNDRTIKRKDDRCFGQHACKVIFSSWLHGRPCHCYPVADSKLRIGQRGERKTTLTCPICGDDLIYDVDNNNKSLVARQTSDYYSKLKDDTMVECTACEIYYEKESLKSMIWSVWGIPLSVYVWFATYYANSPVEWLKTIQTLDGGYHLVFITAIFATIFLGKRIRSSVLLNTVFHEVMCYFSTLYTSISTLRIAVKGHPINLSFRHVTGSLYIVAQFAR